MIQADHNQPQELINKLQKIKEDFKSYELSHNLKDTLNDKDTIDNHGQIKTLLINELIKNTQLGAIQDELKHSINTKFEQLMPEIQI